MQCKLIFSFTAYTGGPNISLSMHNQTSRQASTAQVALTDGVSPEPPVGPTGQVVGVHVSNTAHHAGNMTVLFLMLQDIYLLDGHMLI